MMAGSTLDKRAVGTPTSAWEKFDPTREEILNYRLDHTEPKGLQGPETSAN